VAYQLNLVGTIALSVATGADQEFFIGYLGESCAKGWSCGRDGNHKRITLM